MERKIKQLIKVVKTFNQLLLEIGTTVSIIYMILNSIR